MKYYTIGVDFGTLSGRSVLVEVDSGKVIASAVKEYTHGVMDKQLPDGTRLGRFNIRWTILKCCLKPCLRF